MRKIALDADPGVADALALAFALFDPNVEIVATTSVGGLVDPSTAARNLQSLVAFLDPPRLPRVGVGSSAPPAPAKSPNLSDASRLERRVSTDDVAIKRNVSKKAKRDKTPKIKNGDSYDATPSFNDFNGFALPEVERFAPRSAAAILRDAVRSHPRETSILALGPLTNVARAFRRDPELPFLLNRLVVAGGGAVLNGRNNATEFNIYCDPQAARVVFQAPCAKTFVPFAAADDLVFSFGDLRAFKPRDNVVGEFLRRALLKIFRERRRTLGTEVVCLQEFVAYFALVEPSLCSTSEALSVDEICGSGAPDFSAPVERRPPWPRRPDLEIVRQIDVDAVRQKIVDGFQRIAENSRFPRNR